jgi:hypothetical protein
MRQHGLAAHFQRARGGHYGLAVSLASLSRLSLRSLPEPIFFHSDVPAHCAPATSDRPEIGIASSDGPFLTLLQEFMWESSWREATRVEFILDSP